MSKQATELKGGGGGVFVYAYGYYYIIIKQKHLTKLQKKELIIFFNAM